MAELLCISIIIERGVLLILLRLHDFIHQRFSWRPKFQHQNLTRPKHKKYELTKSSERDELVELHRVDQSLGYFGHSTQQFGHITPHFHGFSFFEMLILQLFTATSQQNIEFYDILILDFD